MLILSLSLDFLCLRFNFLAAKEVQLIKKQIVFINLKIA